jgi:Domain of unknown function (DUF4129)
MIQIATPVDPLGPVDHDPDQIREAACRLVSPDSVCSPRGPTRADQGAPHLGWLEVVARVVVLSLLAAFVVALIWLIVRAIRSRGRRPRRRRRQRRDEADTTEVIGPAIVVDRSREPFDWRREADEHRRSGRFRDAVRCRYRALVGDLARGGVIDEIPGRTTGEERVQMSSAKPNAVTPFCGAADLFDAAWYGEATVGQAELDTMEQLERAVLVALSDRP